MKSYIYFRKLERDLQEAILELTTKSTYQRIKVVDWWLDDSLPCIDVIFETWKRGTVKCSFWNLSMNVIAAFYYPDSPTAQKLLSDLLKMEMTYGHT